MLEIEQQTDREDPEIMLLKEWLPKISGECRAYIKGASKALLFAQESSGSGSIELKCVKKFPEG
jgi:hypothetical protein